MKDLIGSFQYAKGASKKARDGLFTMAYGDRVRGNGLRLREGRFRLDNRKKLFTGRVVRHWNRGCPEKLWTPCPWKCSRSGWLGSD